MPERSERNRHPTAGDSPEPAATYVEEQARIGRIRSGDHAAFKALYDRYADAMFAFAAASLGSSGGSEAQDVVQDVFLTIWRNRARLELTTSSMRGYLLRSVFNKVATLRRHLRVELTAQETVLRHDDWTYRTAADDALNEGDLAQALERAISGLTPRSQQAYRLVREEGLSYQEAAQVMGITVHTLELHVMKALRGLREQLADWRRAGARR
jgi:RNA polymerase sigma factor (sigma-70 family)